MCSERFSLAYQCCFVCVLVTAQESSSLEFNNNNDCVWTRSWVRPVHSRNLLGKGHGLETPHLYVLRADYQANAPNITVPEN